MRRGLFLWLLVLAADFSAFPQIGTPYPGGYPPGGYPGGGYPRGRYPGSGIPTPRRKSKTTPEKDSQEPLQQVTGTLQRIDDTSIVVEAQDTRIITLKRTDKTKFQGDAGEAKAADFKRGDQLLVEARQDENGYLYAVNVILQKRAAAAKPETAENAPPPAPAPNPATAAPENVGPPLPPEPGDQDEGAPKLRRGWSKDRKPSPPIEVAKNTPPRAEVEVEPDGTVATRSADQTKDPVLEKARAAAASFVEGLPNYVCQELIARFVSTSHKVDWQAQDIVSAELVYEDGRERYRNIAINNKPTKKEMQDLPGAWSTGEFGTVLADLFSPATAADFTSQGEAKASGRLALVYDFMVEREHSHWHIMAPSQSVEPAYKGSIWIDKATGNILRVEMQTRQMPREFPFDKVESAVDYQYVRFSEKQFLMPVHAETLTCQRGTSVCSRNKIDFRNYHKYSSESDVTFEKTK
jgi:hypothetical protein